MSDNFEFNFSVFNGDSGGSADGESDHGVGVAEVGVGEDGEVFQLCFPVNDMSEFFGGHGGVFLESSDDDCFDFVEIWLMDKGL